MNKKTLRSTAAVAAGLLAIIILSTATDTVLEATGVFPPVAVQQQQGFTTPWQVALAFGYRTLFDVLGGFITASLAASRPTRHAIVLGAIGTVLGIVGAVAMWGVAPAWYSIGLVVVGLPAVYLGAMLKPARPTAVPT